MGKQFNFAKLAARLAATPTLPPDPDGQNDERAEWAEQAIEAFESATRADREDALCDLLADLMHWADRNGQDFDSQLDRARMHYAAETEPEREAVEITITPLGVEKLAEIAGEKL